MELGPTFRISVPKYPAKDPNYRIIAHQRSRFTHYYFYVRDEVLGPIVILVGSFLSFQATYYLNGHSFIEHQLKAANVSFRKDDNAFLAVGDVAALQAAADKLSPDIIRKRLDYWTFLLGPKFSAKERKLVKLSRSYAISQVEYCFNFVFKRNFPERSCELGLWRLTAHKIAEVFGTRIKRNHLHLLKIMLKANGRHGVRQAFHCHRSDRTRPSRVPRLLPQRRPQAVREVLNVLTQRTLLQQSLRFRSQKKPRPSG
jgi:hypothetical protein